MNCGDQCALIWNPASSATRARTGRHCLVGIHQSQRPTRLPATVDNLEVAQFIYLLVNNERVRDAINTITTKVILILGRFFDECKPTLGAIREELRRRNYIPVLFDFDKPVSRDPTETVRTLAHLARFIVADITDPRSVPQELQAIVPDLAVPVQAVIEETQEPWGMFEDYPKKYHWVMAVHKYRDLDDLLTSLQDKVIGPAEAKAKELEGREAKRQNGPGAIISGC